MRGVSDDVEDMEEEDQEYGKRPSGAVKDMEHLDEMPRSGLPNTTFRTTDSNSHLLGARDLGQYRQLRQSSSPPLASLPGSPECAPHAGPSRTQRTPSLPREFAPASPVLTRASSPAVPELPSLPGSPQPMNGNAYFQNLLDLEPDDDFELDEILDEHQRDYQYDEDDVNFGLPPDDEDEDPPEGLGHLVGIGAAPEVEPEPKPEPEPDDPNEPEDNAGIPAFNEPKPIRNMYINAYLQKSKYHANENAIKDFVSSFEESFSAHPDIGPADLARMARTIGTIERRLGLSSRDLITTYTVCPGCSKHYSPGYIANSRDPDCVADGCDGVLYTDKILSTGATKRVSTRTFPFASLISWIRRMLARDRIAKLLQSWRTPNDRQLGPLISPDAWYEGVDPNKPLEDISHGHGWRSRPAGIHQVIDDVRGIISDENLLEPPIRFSSLPYGLSLSMNVDWYAHLVAVIIYFS